MEKFKKKSADKRKSIIFRVIAALAALFAVLAAASFGLKTVYYEVPTNKVKQRLRIVQISDLHSCRYGKNMETLIKAIDEAAPDVIVLTGDIYDDVVNNANTRKLLENIGRRYLCCYVAGNHEFKPKANWPADKLEAESFGIRVLEGDNVKLKCGVTICGAAKSSDGSLGWYDSIDKCAADTEGFSVLLFHFPDDVNYYRKLGKFDLILCGHNHGGQWRIPFLLNGVFAPGAGFFPDYPGGRYDFDDCTMIVSRGLSRTKEFIPRIFNNPELVVIDIVPE